MTRVPDFLVEQLALGELPKAKAQSVQARLEADQDPRLGQLRASTADILDAHPPDVIARRIQARIDALEPEPAAGFAWPMWGTAAALAVAAAALLVWTLSPGAQTPASDPETRVALVDPPAGERIKGDAAILLKRKLGTRAEPLLANSKVSPGDTVLVSYRSGGWTHGVLVSLDGAGAVTLHFPDTPGDSTALKAEGDAVLHAFELDDAPAFERFLFFTANTPLEANTIVKRVESVGRGPDPAHAPVDPSPAEAVVDLPLIRRSAADPDPQ
ncbi:MAG: hypothetical protein KUG77_06925 [Nannocystaceae bacterium]|nr:hypothetical protein [Nannocystaceae bacterium]